MRFKIDRSRPSLQLSGTIWTCSVTSSYAPAAHMHTVDLLPLISAVLAIGAPAEEMTTCWSEQVPQTLSPAESAALLAELKALRDELLAQTGGEFPKQGRQEFGGTRVRSAYLGGSEEQHSVVNLVEAGGLITGYAAHPRMVAMAEELIGAEARILEHNSIINRRRKDYDPSAPVSYGWHRGATPGEASHEHGSLIHCNFVKTLTNLTELGPDDGGTVVIAGSHRMQVSPADLIAMANADPSLIHQVVAPAGSTLLFGETLMHATGQIRSEKERAIITTGYGPTMFPYWDDQAGDLAQDRWELSAEFRAKIPPSYRTLFLGMRHWNKAPRYRGSLDAEVDANSFEAAGQLGAWEAALAAHAEPAPKL